MTQLIALAKQVKRRLGKLAKPKPFVSKTRRIERVATTARICAMTFDDGPYDLPCEPDSFGGARSPMCCWTPSRHTAHTARLT